MTSSPEQIREEIERTRGDLSDDVNQFADAVDPRQMVARQGEKVKDAVIGVKDRVMGSSEDGLSAASHAPTRAGRWAASTTRRNPWGAGLVAMGAGWIIGSLLPTSEAERTATEKLKETAGPTLSSTVGDAAGTMAEHLREPAMDAAEAVKSTAGQAASHVSDTASEHGVTLPGTDSGQTGSTSGRGYASSEGSPSL